MDAAAGQRARLRLPRSARVTRGGDFLRLREQGRRQGWGVMLANWKPAPDRPASRLGVIVSRKVGPSVTRNRARRLLKEAFRLHQHELAAPVDLVLVARPSIVGCSQAEVERDMLSGWERARLLKVT